MGLNSGGEGLRLTDFKLSLRGMQGVTERNSLNWLFGVSCMVFGLSVECVEDRRSLKKRESAWIKALRTIEPYGLNITP